MEESLALPCISMAFPWNTAVWWIRQFENIPIPSGGKMMRLLQSIHFDLRKTGDSVTSTMEKHHGKTPWLTYQLLMASLWIPYGFPIWLPGSHRNLTRHSYSQLLFLSQGACQMSSWRQHMVYPWECPLPGLLCMSPTTKIQYLLRIWRIWRIWISRGFQYVSIT